MRVRFFLLLGAAMLAATMAEASPNNGFTIKVDGSDLQVEVGSLVKSETLYAQGANGQEFLGAGMSRSVTVKVGSKPPKGAKVLLLNEDVQAEHADVAAKSLPALPLKGGKTVLSLVRTRKEQAQTGDVSSVFVVLLQKDDQSTILGKFHVEFKAEDIVVKLAAEPLLAAARD